MPRHLAITVAVVCGMFAALIAQILLASRGIELAGVWRDLLSARGLQLRSAGAWWLMAASAFVFGAAVAGALSRLPLPWVRLRALRWVAGAAVVFALAHVGHSAALNSGGSVAVHVAAKFCRAVRGGADGAVRRLLRRQAVARTEGRGQRTHADIRPDFIALLSRPLSRAAPASTRPPAAASGRASARSAGRARPPSFSKNLLDAVVVRLTAVGLQFPNHAFKHYQFSPAPCPGARSRTQNNFNIIPSGRAGSAAAQKPIRPRPTRSTHPCTHVGAWGTLSLDGTGPRAGG